MNAEELFAEESVDTLEALSAQAKRQTRLLEEIRDLLAQQLQRTPSTRTPSRHGEP